MDPDRKVEIYARYGNGPMCTVLDERREIGRKAVLILLHFTAALGAVCYALETGLCAHTRRVV